MNYTRCELEQENFKMCSGGTGDWWPEAVLGRWGVQGVENSSTRKRYGPSVDKVGGRGGSEPRATPLLATQPWERARLPTSLLT